MSDRSLRMRDYLVLAGLCAVLFGYSLVEGRTLTIHETVHCENVREMLADHDWIIPHYGGRPWLERPPLPHWLTAIPAALTGHPEREWSMRIGPVLAGLFIVLTTSWMAARWFGRTIGVLSGAVLATTREFLIYATAPECDIFLCAIVTAALACFTAAAFPQTTPTNEDQRFLGRRPLALLGFFLFLGLTNMAKGLFFGMLHVLVPVSLFLLWNAQFRAIRRHVWLWGWLAFAVVAIAWPTAAYLRQPGIVELWRSDYLGRVNNNYMPQYGSQETAAHQPTSPDWGKEPWWYYFANLPLNLLPWTVLAFGGLGLLFRKAWREAGSPQRFLVCWAVLPVLFFSLMQAKHHHYLLHCMAPWAILGAHAALRLWQYLLSAPRWLTRPWSGLLWIALPICAVAIVQHVWFPTLLPGPAWLLPVILAGTPMLVLGAWWALRQSDPRRALAGFFSVLVVLTCALSAYRTFCLDRYAGDRAFLNKVAHETYGQTVFLTNDTQPLEASWFLYYSAQRPELLQNLTYLRDEHIREKEVYVIARQKDEIPLGEYGTAIPVLQSAHSRVEKSPEDRWTLFRLRFHDTLKRVRCDVPISPMQATGRAPGPYLE